MTELTKDDPLDECVCGDRRSDHENGTGRCCMPDNMTHGYKPCLSFRLAFPADGPLSRDGRRLARLALQEPS